MKRSRLIFIPIFLLTSFLILACGDDDDESSCSKYCNKFSDCTWATAKETSQCKTGCEETLDANGSSCASAFSAAASCVTDQTCLEINEQDACMNELKNIEESCQNEPWSAFLCNDGATRPWPGASWRQS